MLARQSLERIVDRRTAGKVALDGLVVDCFPEWAEQLDLDLHVVGFAAISFEVAGAGSYSSRRPDRRTALEFRHSSYWGFIIVEVDSVYMIRPTRQARRSCPECDATVANVQGVDACSECRWRDPRAGDP